MPNSSTSSSELKLHMKPRSHVREIARVIAFVCGALLLDRVAGTALWSLQDQVQTGEMGRVSQLLANKDADIVIFGSSRAKHHFDPAVLESVSQQSVFNAGWDGQGIYYHRFMQQMLLKNGTSARTFILQLDPQDLARSNASRVVSALSPYVDASPETTQIFQQCDDRVVVKQHSQCWRFNSLVGPLVLNWLKPAPSDNGFSALESTGRKLVAQPDRTLPRLKPDPQLVAEYRRFISDARKHGIDVVLVSCPRLDRNEEAEQETWPALQRIAHDEQVTLLALDERRFPQLADPDLYCDAGHLNPEGARALTKLLAQRWFPVVREASDIRLVNGQDADRVDHQPMPKK